MANDPKISFQPEFDGITQAMRKLQDTVSRRPLKVNLATDARGLDGINKGLGRLSGSADEFTKSLEAANARVLAFGASVAVISALQRGFVNLVKSTIEVEAAFAKIAVVGDQFTSTAGQLEKFGRGVFDVARQTGQSFDETSKAALEFARQGLGAAETLTRVKDALVLTRLSGLDAKSSVEGLTAAVNTFKKEGLSTTDVLNKLIAVDNKYAVSSADLIEAIKRSGSFAQEAGVGFDELTATVTVLQEATARGGSVIGNSLKTIFERVGRPESIAQLRQLGVSVTDVNENFLPAIKIIDNFANSLNGMDETAKRTALRQLAGTLQINQLSALTNALKSAEGASRRYDEVVSTSANASIEAAIANEKLNQTLDSQIKGLLATGTQLGSLFGDVTIAPALSNITEALGGIGKFLIDGLSKEGPSFTKALANIIGDGILVAGAAGALSIGLILKKFAVFAKDSFTNVLGINAASKNQEAIQVSILNTLRTREDIEAQLLSLGGNQVAQAQLLAKAYKDAADQDARRIATSKAIAGAIAPSFGIGASGQPTPRGRKGFGAAKGYVPDLIQAEYADIKKGVGGANRNAGVVLIKDFPFGGGKKGPMVANTSEAIAPMGSGAAVLNRDMLDKMGYGKRAAEGEVPSLSLSGSTVASKSGKFLSVGKLEKVVEQTARTLSNQNVAGLKFTNAINKAVREAGFNLTGKSLREIGTTAIRFSKELKTYETSVKDAYDLQIKENAQKRKLRAAESARVSKIKTDAANLSDPLSKAAMLNNIGYSNTSQSKARTQIGGGNPLALSRSITRLGGFGGMVDGKLIEPFINTDKGVEENPEYKKSFGAFNPLGSYQPVRGQAKSSDPLTRATQIGLERRLAAIENQPRGFSAAANAVNNFEVRNRTSGGSMASFGASERLASEQTDLADSTEEISKSFSEAATEFGAQTGTIFLGASVLKEAFSVLGFEIDTTIDTIRDLAIAFVGIKKLSELGGLNAGSGSRLLGGVGGNFGRAFSARRQGLGSSAVGLLAGNSRAAKVGSILGSVAGGLTKFSAGFVRLLPVIGQVAIGLFAVNSVLKYFGINAYASIREFVTGLSAEGERAKESLETFSKSLFENGQFVGKTREDVFRDLKLQQTNQQASIRAKLQGVDTEGKKPEEVQSELFRKQIGEILGKQKTGNRVEVVENRISDVGGYAVNKSFATGVFRKELVSDLPKDVQTVLADLFARIGSLSEEELKTFAKDKKIEVSAKDGLEQLREKIITSAFEYIRSPDIFNLSSGGKESATTRLTGYFQGKPSLRAEQQARDPELFSNPETAQAQVASAIQLKKLQLDFATDAERILETQIKTSQISNVERADLQARLEVLKLERSLRGDIFDIATKNLDKLAGEGGYTIKVEELKSGVEQIKGLGLGVEETKRQIVALIDTLGGDQVLETTKAEILAQLSGIDDISAAKRGQLGITNEQLKAEAKITEQIRAQQSLATLKNNSKLSDIESRKSLTESQIALLNAQSSNPNLPASQQANIQRSTTDLQIKNLREGVDTAKIRREEAKKNLFKDKDQTLEEQVIGLKLIEDEYERANRSINDQITALETQKNYIGQSASAMTLLANAAYQFSQNLGEVESSNILNALRSTDTSSLGSALASQQAFGDLQSSGKTGLEGEKFLAERTALRQKEFEIASATTSVQKIQLTQEKKALEDIISIKERGGNVDEQIAALIEAQNKRLKEQRSLRSGVGNATAQMRDEISTFNSDFGEAATFGFKDALSEALKAAANGTGDLKNSLLDVALSFANKLRDAALDNLAKIATNALFGNGGGGGGNLVSGGLKAVGSFFGGSGMASGGPVTGGSGTKDDVPIMGMGGEFMINKQSVKKYGPQLFEALNEGRLQKMAKGGLVDPGISGKAIRGSQNLLAYASQNATSGATDKMFSLGSGAGLVELEPESVRLTNFARQSGNPLQSATQEAKDQALGLFFQDKDLRKQYKEQMEALKKARKERQKQLLISAAVTVAGAAVGSYFNAGTPSELGSTNMTGGRNISDRPPGLSSGSSLSSRNVVSSARRASGGVVNGDGYGDNVPALLNGGEGVLNPKAMKNLGVSKLNAINSGQSTGVSDEKSEELNEKLISKLDELVQKLSAQNNVTVNVAMDKNGQTTASEDGKQSEDQKNMNRRIKEAVVQILQEEKRLGGTLRGK